MMKQNTDITKYQKASSDFFFFSFLSYLAQLCKIKYSQPLLWTNIITQVYGYIEQYVFSI